MTATVSGLWRHPIKSHGREALKAVVLTAGCTHAVGPDLGGRA